MYECVQARPHERQDIRSNYSSPAAATCVTQADPIQDLGERGKGAGLRGARGEGVPTAD